MAVPNETIIKKMMDELQQAQLQENNHDQMIKHIGNVRLLSDLIIDNNHVDKQEKIPTDAKKISADEMKAMLGNSKSKKLIDSEEVKTNDDEENGKSIFDF